MGVKHGSLSKLLLQKMVTTQCKMEWIMMGLTLHDRKCSSWICSKTGVIDVIHQICTNKHQWAGYVSQLKGNRWTKCVTEWCPWDHKWPRSHPKRHWQDDLEEFVGPNWSHVAKDWHCWTISRGGVPPTGVKQKPWWWWFCVLTETRIKSNDNLTHLHICPDGYKALSSPRKDHMGGGIAIIFRNHLNIKEGNIYEFTSMECMDYILTLPKSWSN